MSLNLKKVTNKVVATAKNAADEALRLSPQQSGYACCRPLTYTILKAGSEAGVTHDKTSHTVTVDKDNGQGQSVTGNNPTFTRTYKAAPAKAITAKKVLMV